MKRSTWLVLVPALVWAAGCAAHKQSTTASIDETPQPVREAFVREFPNAKVTSLRRETGKGGAVVWTVRFIDPQFRKCYATYAPDGLKLESRHG